MCLSQSSRKGRQSAGWQLSGLATGSSIEQLNESLPHEHKWPTYVQGHLRAAETLDGGGFKSLPLSDDLYIKHFMFYLAQVLFLTMPKLELCAQVKTSQPQARA